MLNILLPAGLAAEAPVHAIGVGAMEAAPSELNAPEMTRTALHRGGFWLGSASVLGFVARGVLARSAGLQTGV